MEREGNIDGKLVPMIELRAFKRYIRDPFGSATFKLRKSLSSNSYILEYRVGGELLGSVEVPVWRNAEGNVAYIILHQKNVSGSEDAFKSLFQEIQGKMIGRETRILGHPVFKGKLDGSLTE
ncbi:hypothetical protein GF325_07935 [Candidatus Bathyarchaeota archaeon]|nr:hypothetical protein [Candidatus Bathyarchaeota archaeon]